ncbi:MAG: putative rane protein [Microbacteriaceae bacterium]|nr:putative rane protein [Microbacteriaceae bacterium]
MTDHTPPEVPPTSLPSSSLPDAAAPAADSAPAAPPTDDAQAYASPTFAPPPPTGLSITSFVLGLVSIFFGFIFFVPLVGLVLGILAVKREPTARGFAVAGIWINAVMLGLVVLGVVVIVILVAVFGAFSLPYMNQIVQVPSSPA